MRNAYALLGLSFLIVFGAAYILLSQKVEAPTPDSNLADKVEILMALSLTSPVFQHNTTIPSKYTCDGENINPPLEISGVPEGTETLVLVMDDPDIPEEVKSARGIEKFNHWAVYELPADLTDILEGSAIGLTGYNSRGEQTYTGPCPPPEYEPTEHRYVFRLYALSSQLNFVAPPTLDELEAAAQGLVIESAELIGWYSRVTE